ncbi:MAG: hypothetical protein IJC75_06655 [Oscillospiraceae bacterium]|nr:hypothetical protein [Oscillospiraceae bacterium]
MEAANSRSSQYLQDHMATQGLLAVSAALLFWVMHWCCPTYSILLLERWRSLCEASPTAEEWLQMVVSWFV